MIQEHEVIGDVAEVVHGEVFTAFRVRGKPNCSVSPELTTPVKVSSCLAIKQRSDALVRLRIVYESCVSETEENCVAKVSLQDGIVSNRLLRQGGIGAQQSLDVWTLIPFSVRLAMQPDEFGFAFVNGKDNGSEVFV